MLGIHPVHAVTPNSAKAVLRCEGLLPATLDCNNTSLTPFETVVYDLDHDGHYAAVDPIIVGPTPADGALLKNDAKILYRDTTNVNHWVASDSVFYDTNGTLAGRVFLAGPPTIRTGAAIRTDPWIMFADANGNGVLDGVVAVTVRLEDLGGTLLDGSQQDVAAINEIFTFDHNLLQVICTSTPCGTSGSSVLSGQFDSWCITNALFCNPAAGKYTYLVDNYCVAAGGSTFDTVTPDNLLGRVSSSSFCGASGSYDYGLGCDPATRNATLTGTCPGDITNSTSPGTGALSNLDVLRVEFMIMGTGTASIDHVAGAAGTSLTDVDGTGSASVPVSLYNTTFSNGSNVPPVASFTYSPTVVALGQSVSFDGTASSDADGIITSYQWSFGDTTPPLSLTVPTTTHSFTNPGSYDVSLTVSDNGGATNTASQTLVVGSLLPVALFTVTPSQPLTGELVTFNASQSHDPRHLSLTYTWQFGDGSSNSANATIVAHTYTQQGEYVATLTLNDTAGLISSTTRAVLVTRIPYVPGVKAGEWARFLVSGNTTTTQGLLVATVNVTMVTGTNVTFTSTLLFMNGTTVHQSDTVSVLVFNGLMIPANLTAGDILGAPFGISVATINSTITGTFVGASRQANQLILNYKNSSLASSLSAEWDQTSGVLLGLNSSLSTGPGQTSTEELVIVDTNIWPATQNRLPIPIFAWKPLYGIVSQQVSFNATRSYDPDTGDQVASYHWDFGDGTSTTATSATASHTYSTAGRFNVTLTVTDSVGGSFGFVRSITVLLPLTLVVTTSPASPVTGILPLQVNFTSTASGGLHPYSYSWDFGDNTHSTIADPSHTYTATGSFTVELTLTDSTSAIITASVTVEALSPLTIIVNASPTAGRAPMNILFTASASGGTTPYTFTWSAPGGSPAGGSAESFATSYSSGGTYTTSVTMTDSAGHTASSSLTVTVSPAYASLKILVTDSNGNPLQGATVKLSGGTTGQSLIGQQTSGADGSVTFTNLLPGDYSYQIVLGTYQTPSKTVSVSEGAALSSAVTLAPVQTPPNPVNYALFAGIGAGIVAILSIGYLTISRRRKPSKPL